MNQPTSQPDGIGWILDSAQQPLHPQMRPLVQGAIIDLGETLSRFLVWSEAEFIGFRATKEDALTLAHQQPPGIAVYVCDAEGMADDYQTAFCVVAGVEGKVGPLPSQIRNTGFGFAQDVLARNVSQKRDVMLNTQAILREKHGGNLPPLDSPPHPDQEMWNRITQDFENATIWHRRFLERHNGKI